MNPYLLLLGPALLVGIVYSLLNVRLPAPPAIALLGILLGEQVIPLARRVADGPTAGLAWMRFDGAEHVLGKRPGPESRA